MVRRSACVKMITWQIKYLLGSWPRTKHHSLQNGIDKCFFLVFPNRLYFDYFSFGLWSLKLKIVKNLLRSAQCREQESATHELSTLIEEFPMRIILKVVNNTCMLASQVEASLNSGSKTLLSVQSYSKSLTLISWKVTSLGSKGAKNFSQQLLAFRTQV